MIGFSRKRDHMAEEKKEKIIEGKVVDKKSVSGKSHQYVSEKTVVLVVLGIVLIAGGYFAYGPVSDWITNLTEKKTPQTTELTLSKDEDQEPTPETTGRAAALETEPVQTPSPDYENRLQAIEDSLKTLSEQTPAETQPQGPDPRVAKLEDEVAALKAELENRPETVVRNNATFAQAVAALAPPLYQSQPFEGPLEQVRILILEMPTLSQATLSDPLSVLSKNARTGVPSLSALEAGLEKAGIEALKIEGLSEDAGWWDKTWAKIKGLVVVRKTDGSGGTPLEEILVQASHALPAGDLGRAIDLISALPPAEQGPFSDWLMEAKKRDEALKAHIKLVEFIPASANQGATAKP